MLSPQDSLYFSFSLMLLLWNVANFPLELPSFIFFFVGWQTIIIRDMIFCHSNTQFLTTLPT
jgi:hypothetical protein